MNEKKMKCEELVCSENCWIWNLLLNIPLITLNPKASHFVPLKNILRMTYIIMNFQIHISILQKKDLWHNDLAFHLNFYLLLIFIWPYQNVLLCSTDFLDFSSNLCSTFLWLLITCFYHTVLTSSLRKENVRLF
jgi:hypothetical protein